MDNVCWSCDEEGIGWLMRLGQESSCILARDDSSLDIRLKNVTLLNGRPQHFLPTPRLTPRHRNCVCTPVYVGVVSFKPGKAENNVHLAQGAHRERNALDVVSEAHNKLHLLADRTPLVERAIDVVDGDGALELPGGEVVFTHKLVANKFRRRATVHERDDADGVVRVECLKLNFDSKGPREVNVADVVALGGRRKNRRVKRLREESRTNNDIIAVVVGTTGLDLEYTEAVGATSRVLTRGPRQKPWRAPLALRGPRRRQVAR